MDVGVQNRFGKPEGMNDVQPSACTAGEIQGLREDGVLSTGAGHSDDDGPDSG